MFKNRALCLVLSLFISLFSLSKSIAANTYLEALEKAKSFVEEKKYDKAIEKFEKLDSEKLSNKEKDLRAFSLAEWLQQVGQNQKSLEYLLQIQTNEYVPKEYSQYLIGHAYKMSNEYEKAMKAFSSVIDQKPNRSLVYDARFEFSEMAMQLGKETKAHAHLKYLERRWRGSVRHPEVIWRLISVEMARKRKWLACRWARKMYSSYSGHELVSHWGADLPNNTFNGKPLGCLATTNDLERRIKRLQLYGQAQRAREELDLMISRSPKSTKHEVDILLAEFLISQGYPDEALQTLIQHYEKLKNDFDYQLLLAKTASKASESTTAVGAYYRAYNMQPRSAAGRRALFSAAFLSYQSQDYDGASRKFQELVKKHPGSGLARDSKWHLAWIRYLRQDYKGAQVAFEKLQNETYGSRRRRYRPFNDDRTRYWLAMSYLRQDNQAQAKSIFSKIVSNNSFSYYSLLSEERMASIKLEITLPRSMASSELINAETSNATDLATTQPEGESEEAMGEEEQDGASSEQADIDTPIESEEERAEESKEEKLVVSSFADPKLQKRFDVASMLINLGYNDWARFELYEIERRTTNKKYLRMLMQAYDKIGSYNRSVYISEIFFSSARQKEGLVAGKDLWQWNFPYAYRNSVQDYSQRFGVDDTLILSIMRAESLFYRHAISPVGARGLMQLMPYTAEKVAKLLGDQSFKDEELMTADLNIRYGSRYLLRLTKQFQGYPTLVSAAYNAGPHRVKSWLNSFGNLEMDEFVEHIPFVETRNYVKKVLRHHVVYNSLYKNKQNRDIAWMFQSIPVKVADRPSPRENWGSLD